MNIEVQKTSLEGLLVIKTKVYQDARGLFLELYKTPAFKTNGLPVEFLQDNISLSRKGVIRGLHYQIHPRAQGKLVTCLTGAIFDVCVDIRPGSPSFGKYETFELRSGSGMMVYVPEGFAHGIQALDDDTRILYKCTDVYSPEHERGIRFNDVDLKIPWPLASTDTSPKDAVLPTWQELQSSLR